MPDLDNDDLDDYNSQTGDLYPIFPITNALFFPKTIITLHIFEPRYRKLLRDIQEFGDKKFVITGLLTTNKPFINTKPDTLGVMVELMEEEKMSDGRSNIVLMVTDRVKIREDKYFRPYDIISTEYAIAEIEYCPEEPIDTNSIDWVNLRKELYLEFKTHFERVTRQKLKVTEESIAESFTPEESINGVCNNTLLDYQEKLSLLTLNSLYERGLRILEIYRRMNKKYR